MPPTQNESLGLGGETPAFDPSAANSDAAVAAADANAEAGEGADAEAEAAATAAPGLLDDDEDDLGTDGPPEPPADVRELPKQPATLEVPSDNPTVKNLTALAMNRLNGVVESAKLSEQEFGIVTRCVQRLTELAVLQTAGSSPKQTTSLQERADLDLASLAAIAASKEIDVEREVRNTVYLTVAESFRAALGILAKYAVAAAV